MTLRTVAIPDPPAGADWATVVPGRYLYDVTGITATLTTGGGAVTAIDSSGNGHDGTYHDDPTYGVPGLVAGDTAVEMLVDAGVVVPFAGVDLDGDFTIIAWLDPSLPNGGLVSFGDAGFQYVHFDWSPLSGTPVATLTRTSTSGTVEYVSDPVPTGAHMVGVDFSDFSCDFYVDGVLLTSVPTTDFDPLGATPDRMLIGSTTSLAQGVYDEVSVFTSSLGSAGQATIFFAAAMSFADYTAAVLGFNPEFYFHLDEEPTTGPRQVTLEIATSTGPVELLGTGFPLATGPGPYAYSWQPNLPASTQVPGGSLTTVAIPRILVPAGYTIESDTLDITPGDQWSNITLWWDDRAMLARNAVTPYAYPPGVKLVYRPQGATP